MSEGCCEIAQHASVVDVDQRLRDGVAAVTVHNWTRKRHAADDAWGPQIGVTKLRAHRLHLGLAAEASASAPTDPMLAKLENADYVPSDHEIAAATRRALLRKIGELSGKDLAQLRLQELKTEEQRLRVEEKQGKHTKGEVDDERAELIASMRGALGHVRPMRHAS